MKSALFVDFDNVYSGLRKLDPMIAERFGRQPLEWVQWLIKDLALPDGASADAQRRLLGQGRVCRQSRPNRQKNRQRQGQLPCEHSAPAPRRCLPRTSQSR